MRSAAVFDLDGTVANDEHRRKLVSGRVKKYNEYFSLADKDSPKTEVIELVNLYHRQGFAIIILTGRPERYRDITSKWLLQNNIPYDLLEMRGDGDYRKAPEMKFDVFMQRLKPHFNIKIAFDDESNIIDMWKGLGFEAVKIA